MRNATQHNALQSEDWWWNVQENDAAGASDWMPYKGFSGAEPQLSLGAQCQLVEAKMQLWLAGPPTAAAAAAAVAAASSATAAVATATGSKSAAVAAVPLTYNVA